MKKKRKKISGGFVPVLNIMIDSEAFKELSGIAFKLYIYIAKFYWKQKSTNTEFSIPYSRFRTLMSKPTFYKCLRELVARGFLEAVEKGGLMQNPNKYIFSDKYQETNQKLVQQRKERQSKKVIRSGPWGGIISLNETIDQSQLSHEKNI
ncbi:MAG: hypothetical protein NC906_01575 [Candidatus Omnitrophica bacterium]|nr:hypothetical protein [Candidatus Omnitrophota bacterium]